MQNGTTTRAHRCCWAFCKGTGPRRFKGVT
jgi:hypothetical protein